jgi:energy-converting hydrogenase Eha subunit G
MLQKTNLRITDIKSAVYFVFSGITLCLWLPGFGHFFAQMTAKNTALRSPETAILLTSFTWFAQRLFA